MRNFITSMVATTIYYTQDTTTAIQLVFICIFRERIIMKKLNFSKLRRSPSLLWAEDVNLKFWDNMSLFLVSILLSILETSFF